ncbi:TPA: hypothetical protein ACXJEO_000014 [Serratia marcescens]|nr:hypothetical protein [Serratia marcescens]
MGCDARWLVDRYNIRQSMLFDKNGESLQVDPTAYLDDWDLLCADVLDTLSFEWRF